MNFPPLFRSRDVLTFYALDQKSKRGSLIMPRFEMIGILNSRVTNLAWLISLGNKSLSVSGEIFPVFATDSFGT